MSLIRRLTALGLATVIVIAGRWAYAASGSPEATAPASGGQACAPVATVLAGDVVQPAPAFIDDVYPTSTVYRVSVNGTTVPVTSYKSTAYAQFGFSGTARITITMDRPVPPGLIVSPLSAGQVSATIKVAPRGTAGSPGKTIRLRLGAAPQSTAWVAGADYQASAVLVG